VERDGECSITRFQLARVYGTLFSFGQVSAGRSLDDTLDAALRLAADARQIDPTEPRVRAVLSFLHLVGGDVAAGLREAEASLSLMPLSCFFMDSIGYLLVLLGEWERGVEITRRAMRTNPCYRLVVHFGLWLDALRRGDYEASYEEATQCRGSVDLWEPLTRTASLALLGRRAEAERSARELLTLRPDFPLRARWLIERYVKHDHLVELLMDALGRAGVAIDARASAT
jgi:adenylate cyclase